MAQPDATAELNRADATIGNTQSHVAIRLDEASLKRAAILFPSRSSGSQQPDIPRRHSVSDWFEILKQGASDFLSSHDNVASLPENLAQNNAVQAAIPPLKVRLFHPSERIPDKSSLDIVVVYMFAGNGEDSDISIFMRNNIEKMAKLIEVVASRIGEVESTLMSLELYLDQIKDIPEDVKSLFKEIKRARAMLAKMRNVLAPQQTMLLATNPALDSLDDCKLAVE